MDLFGKPDRWGQTLRKRLWAHATCTIGPFEGRAETTLQVPCSFDVNLAGTKYFYALEQGEIPLLFLFSGSIFYVTKEGRLQVERISWTRNADIAFR
jgi:Family of unknown function (DUF6084)